MSRPRKKILLRADGNSSIGLGHVARCCALAQMLTNDFDCYFYIRKTSKEVIEDIQRYCVDVVELDDSISYEEEAAIWSSKLNKEEIVVLDGYNFNTQYQSRIKSQGCKLVCIDDIYAYHFVADAVINHAPCISKENYSSEPYTRVYVGTEYVLLKKHFLNKASVAKKKLELTSSPILICLGGADPQNRTLSVINEIQKSLPDKKIIVVVGAAYGYTASLEKYCADNSNVSLLVNIPSEELMCTMEKAHVAVTSASTIALEYICVKGNLFLLQTANNQKNIYESLIEKKCAYPFDLLKDNHNSSANIHNQYSLIDGKSDERILEIFSGL